MRNIRGQKKPGRANANSSFVIRRSHRSGFTIIEVLTALTIFGLIMVAIFGAYSAIIRGSVSGNRAAASVQRSRIALRTVEQALDATRSFMADVQYYSFDAENGTEPYLSFVSRLSPSFPRSGRFGDFDVRRVTFAIEPGPAWGKQLVLRQNPVLMEMDEDEKNYPVVLARDVRKFEMEFWDKRQTEWLDEWTQTNQLPQMVKFTLQLGGGEPNSPPQEEITRIIALPSVGVQASWQAPGAAAGGNLNDPGIKLPLVRKMNIARGNSKSGIALIVVMIAIFVLSVLAGAFAYSMKIETKLAMNANNQADLEWIGRSGVEYARWVLALQLTIPNEPYDSLNQKWAGGPGSNASSNSPLADVSLDNVLVGNGSFSVKIKDLERKININTADQDTLERALRAMGADANAISSIADSILDWIDRDDSSHVNGAESDFYQGLTPPYLAKNGPIDDLSELLLIKGILDQPELYWGPSAAEHLPAAFQKVDRFGNALETTYAFGLVDVFTPISTGRVNINTAPAQTLEALFGDPNIAQQVIRVRSGPDGADGTDDDTPFASVGELATVGFQNTAQGQLNRYCTVRSSTFEVEVDAQVGSSKETFCAILGRVNARDIQVLSFYRK